MSDMPLDEITADSNVEDILRSLVEHDAEYTLAPQWVSVDERLPLSGALVFTHCASDNTFGADHTWFDGTFDTWFNEQPVTHWMPIPEPPS